MASVESEVPSSYSLRIVSCVAHVMYANSVSLHSGAWLV